MNYTRILLSLLFCLAPFALPGASPFTPTENLPSAYEGRFRSLESTARLWLYDFSHKQQFPGPANPSALHFLWEMHFRGHSPWDKTPLFWVHYAETKHLLGLDAKRDRFSYEELRRAFYDSDGSRRRTADFLAGYGFVKAYHDPSNRSGSEKLELTGIVPGLWVAVRDGSPTIVSLPHSPLWQDLKSGTSLDASINPVDGSKLAANRPIAEETLQLIQQLQQFEAHEGSKTAESLRTVNFPLDQRLRASGTTLTMLPLKHRSGEWVSLHAFHVPKEASDNFTAFADEQFRLLRDAYFTLENAVLSDAPGERTTRAAASFAEKYQAAYAPLAGTPYRAAQGKELAYPSAWRLRAETLYYHLPLIEASIGAYAIALLLMLAGHLHPRLKFVSKWLFLFLILGFAIHTTVLILRCYILQRPPVSNMFETVVYVPWVAVVTGFLFYAFGRSRSILAAATLASLALLVLLRLTQVDSRLENVQAVLDSQYWLIIHVLMVVGSYGAFVVCGILGHAYLVLSLLGKEGTPGAKSVAAGILHTMYLGVGLLIPGTILGGVWAAESWGRFWDWDPKESWAFISACVYVLFIHAHTFKKIGDFGLAVGAVAGLVAISFTWYGVNYILGTGLHSYGFGKGGEGYYFAYLGIEMLFLAAAVVFRKASPSVHSWPDEKY